MSSYLSFWLLSTCLYVCGSIIAKVLDAQQDDHMAAMGVDCSLKRNINYEGFHRDLITSVVLSSNDTESNDDWISLSVSHRRCDIMLRENFPAGIYLDLYQLNQSHQFGSAPKVYSIAEFDLERPEHQSPPHTVLVYSSLRWIEGHTHEDDMLTKAARADVNLAIHIRYHRASNDHDFVEVRIPPPDVFFSCAREDSDIMKSAHLTVPATSISAPCAGVETKVNCTWIQVVCPLHASDSSADIIITVPVGRLKDFKIVTMATIFVTLVTVIILVITLLRHPRTVK